MDGRQLKVQNAFRRRPAACCTALCLPACVPEERLGQSWVNKPLEISVHRRFAWPRLLCACQVDEEVVDASAAAAKKRRKRQRAARRTSTHAGDGTGVYHACIAGWRGGAHEQCVHDREGMLATRDALR